MPKIFIASIIYDIIHFRVAKMVVNKRLRVQTKGHCDLIDITRQVAQEVANSGVDSGIVTLFVAGSTAGISTIEFEPGLISDFQELWERTVPSDKPYHHDLRWGDNNGYSHVRASLLGASLTVPFVNKKLTLGTWQQIIIADFDNRSRSRELILQIMGE